MPVDAFNQSYNTGKYRPLVKLLIVTQHLLDKSEALKLHHLFLLLRHPNIKNKKIVGHETSFNCNKLIVVCVMIQ